MDRRAHPQWLRMPEPVLQDTLRSSLGARALDRANSASPSNIDHLSKSTLRKSRTFVCEQGCSRPRTTTDAQDREAKWMLDLAGLYPKRIWPDQSIRPQACSASTVL